MLPLRPHPDTPVARVQQIDVAVWQEDGRWHFRYLVGGRTDLIVPDAAPPYRADELWRTTCFEAFVGLNGGAYLEFNFSPSGQWSAYRFDSPRQGMRNEAAEIEVWVDAGEDWLGVEAAVECKALEPGLTLGLSAILEETDGDKSYWALKHPAGEPDFHDRSCFAALLANIGPT